MVPRRRTLVTARTICTSSGLHEPYYAAHALLLRLPVRVADDERDLVRGWELARRYDNHPVYDMIYVALAERRQTELITTDESLRRRLAQLTWIVGP